MALVTDTKNLSMILVMGVTGSGKSYFINKLANQNVAQTSNRLKSCKYKTLYDTPVLIIFSEGTEECQLVTAMIGRTKLLLLDTPGFDDTVRSDSEILAEICKVLAAQYTIGMELRGVICLHRITDVRYGGSSVKTFKILKEICRQDALKNVLLVTTRWNDVEESLGATREQQLRTDFWAYMLHHGSNMTRFNGNRESASSLASQLINKDTITLEIQHELIDQGKQLKDTMAGSLVNDELSVLKRKYEQELEDLEELRRTLQDQDLDMKRQIQKDWKHEQARLQKTQDDEIVLKSKIGQEVRQKIHDKKKGRTGKVLKTTLSFLPFALGILGMFVGIPIPMGTGGLLSGWLAESGVFDSVTDFFSDF